MADIRACLGLIFGGLGTGRDSSFVSGFPVYSIDGRKICGVFGCLGAGKEFIITGLVSSLLYMKKKVIEMFWRLGKRLSPVGGSHVQRGVARM